MFQGFLGADNLNPVYWSLKFEIIFYLYFAISHHILNNYEQHKNIKLFITLIIFIGILILSIVGGIIRKEYGLHLPTQALVSISLFFYGSIYFYLIKQKNYKSIIFLIAVYGILI